MSYENALGVAAGDVIELSSSWSGINLFRVDTVREPSHALAQGIVFEGCYWRWQGDSPHYSERRVIHVLPNNLKGFRGIADADTLHTFGVPIALPPRGSVGRGC